MTARSQTDVMLARLAGRQKGVFALWQLDADEVLRKAIRLRARTHRLSELHPGVFAYGHRQLAPDGHRLAAVLAYGPTAVISHRSAAAMWELLPTAQTRIDVTVPGTSRRPRRGIALHRTRELRPDEIVVRDGVPVTTVTRTLCDLAALTRAGPARGPGGGRRRVSERQLRRAVQQADRCGRLDLRALRAAIDRHPTRRGSAVLRRILDDYAPLPFTRSELERRFLELIRAAGLPRPSVNCRVAGLEVDIHWPQWRLVVELDGRAYHSDPSAFERDPVRDARLLRAGCLVLRVTAKRLTHHPEAVLADIRALAALAESG